MKPKLMKESNRKITKPKMKEDNSSKKTNNIKTY